MKQTAIVRCLQRPHALLASAGAVVLLGACATTTMEAQWRDPQVPPQALKGKSVMVACRGLDMTLERICEERMSADLQAAGIKVVRGELPRAPEEDAWRKAAAAARADAVLAASLEPAANYVAPSGGSVGVGVGGSSGSYGSRSGAGIGISLPIGGATGPGIGASTSLTDAASGKLMWSARAVSPKTSSEAEQISQLSRVTVDALKASNLF